MLKFWLLAAALVIFGARPVVAKKSEPQSNVNFPSWMEFGQFFRFFDMHGGAILGYDDEATGFQLTIDSETTIARSEVKIVFDHAVALAGYLTLQIEHELLKYPVIWVYSLSEAAKKIDFKKELMRRKRGVMVKEGISRLSVTLPSGKSVAIKVRSKPKKKAVKKLVSTDKRSATNKSSKKANKPCTLTRAYLDDELGDGYSRIIRQARLIPNTTSAKMNGFKVFAIVKPSLWETVGIKNGDVIVSSSGQPLERPEQGFDIFKAFRKDSVHFEVMRNGKKIDIRCTINS